MSDANAGLEVSLENKELSLVCLFRCLIHTSLKKLSIRRNGVVPDKKLYSVLISAVGSADPQAVLTMQDHLLKENVVGSEVLISSSCLHSLLASFLNFWSYA